MKIKYWLLTSYLIVMLLPLAAGYLLFAWINMYHNERNVEEHVELSLKLHSTAAVLNDPALYKAGADRSKVDEQTSPQLSIALYNRDGIVLYTSDPTLVSKHFALGKEQLYSDLYQIEQGYRTYRYKEPVFQQQELVGFFEMHLSRDEWAAGVANRSKLMTALFIGLFILIYGAVIFLVHRKLNRRLDRLMGQMTAFAQNLPFKKTRASKDEIGQLTNHFYKMIAEIESARIKIAKQQQEKEFLIASVSHDLKTPLTSIRAYAESLASDSEKLTEQERVDYLKTMIEKANVMKQMLDDLTMYTILQSPTYDLELTEVDSAEFFDMLISDYDALCKEKNISLHKHCDISGSIYVHPRQMMRVADNLMSNAIQHTNSGGEITIAAFFLMAALPDKLFPFVKRELEQADDENSIYFIVQNKGEGMDGTQIQHAFEPLYQGDQARSKKHAQGTGLGLSITKQIVEKHGGSVRILSRKNIGTCVVCTLPNNKYER